MKKAKIVVVLALAVLLVFSSIAVSFAQEGDTQVVPTTTVSPEATASIDPQPTETADPQATASVDPQPTEAIDPQATETMLAAPAGDLNTVSETTESVDTEQEAVVETIAAGALKDYITINGEPCNTGNWQIFNIIPNNSAQIEIGALPEAGVVTFNWLYAPFGKTINDATSISDQSILKIDHMTASNYGHYWCKISDSTGTTVTVAIRLSPDMQLKVTLNPIEIVAGKPISASGTVSMKKLEGMGDLSNIKILLLCAGYTYNVSTGEKEDYSDSIIEDFTLDEMNVSTNGIWHGNQKIIVDDDVDFIVEFTMKFDSIPASLYRDGDDFVSIIYPKMIYAGMIDSNGMFGNQSKNVELNLPKTHNSTAGESMSKDNAVKLKGDFPVGAEVALSDVSDTGIVSAMQNALKSDEQFVWLKDISLEVAGQHIAFNRELTVSVWMGEAYNGKTLKILHYNADGQVEELSGTITDGYLTFKTTGLSPFGVVANNTAGGGSGSAGTTKSPKTGDESLPLALLIVMAAGAVGSIALVLKKKRQHSA